MHDRNTWVDFFTGETTFNSIIDGVLSVETPESAINFFNAYAQHILIIRPELNLKQAGEIARSNIGYCFGEGMKSEIKRMWNQFTGAAHPYFGLHEPTAVEAFEMGCRLGDQMRFEKIVSEEVNEQLLSELEERGCTRRSPLPVRDVAKK